MELHESLHELGSRLGHGLFTDAENFRGALDDYVDETSASVGDINLLVDAVRLGAYRSMTSMLDSGASSDSAIAEAGARLARDRGSADANGAMWACAVLGYAIDKVTVGQVRHYAGLRTGMTPPPASPSAPTGYAPQSPVQSPQPPPYRGPQPPPYQSPQQRPRQSPQPPPMSPPTAPPARPNPPAASPPSPPAQSGQPGPSAARPQQPTIWPSSGGVTGESSADRTAAVQHPSSVDPGTNPRMPAATQRPDSAGAPPRSEPSPGQPAATQFQSGGAPQVRSTPSPTGPATPSYASSTPSVEKKSKLIPILGAAAAVLLVVGIGVPVVLWLTGGDDGGSGSQTIALDDVNKDYAALAEDVTAGAKECTKGERALGQREVVDCTLDEGTLRLVTYNGADELASARSNVVTDAQGNLTSQGDDGVFYAYDPTDVENAENPALVYWDSDEGVQSATYTAAKDAEDGATALLAIQEKTKPTTSAPSDVEDSDLETFIEDFGLDDCERVVTTYAGEPEESLCSVENYDVSAGRFSSVRDLQAVRDWAREGAKQDGCPNRYASANKPKCENSNYYTDAAPANDEYRASDGDIELGRVWGFVDEEDDDRGVLYIERVDCLCYLIAYDDGAGDPDALSLALERQLEGS